MACIFKKTLVNIFLFIFLIYFVQSAPEEINLEAPTNQFQNNSNKEYKFTPKFKEANYAYVKIEMISSEPTADFIFSFYKGDDSNLNKRIQLSQSVSSKAFMYLKKEELGTSFYIKTEFKGTPSLYNLTLTQANDTEISIGEQYSYYITKDNQLMNFTIIGKPIIKHDFYNYVIHTGSNTSKLSIWAKGALDLKTEVNLPSEEVKSLNKTTLNSHIIELKTEDEIRYNLKVSGTEGDYITIGVTLFNKDNVCQTVISDKNNEIFGFLRKGFMDKIHLPMINTFNLLFTYNQIIDHDNSILQTNPKTSSFVIKDLNLTVYTLSLDTSLTESFYSFKFTKKKTNQTNSDFIETHLMLIGPTYRLSLEKGESIGFIPMKTSNNYLTLHVNAESGKYKASLITCKTYPFCKDSDTDKVRLKQYNSALISYDNTQYSKDSVIEHNQKILLLNCESQKCAIIVNMYTEKNNISILPLIPYYRYVRENNEDNLIIDVTQEARFYSAYKFNLHIEILSGISDADITFNEGKRYEYDNMVLYEVDQGKKNLFPLKIKAKKNIVYSIIALEQDTYLKPQINYLKKFTDLENEITIKPESDDISEYLYFIGFFPLNFDMSFKFYDASNDSIQYNNMLQSDKYYQDFRNYSELSSVGKRYKISRLSNETNKDTLFYRISIFRHLSELHPDESIILSYNKSYPFIFTQKNHKMKYIYLHSDKNKGLSLNIELIDKIKYKLELLFNDKLYKNYEFNDNYVIDISPEEMGKQQNDNMQPIQVNFIISLDNCEKDSVFKLNVSDYHKKESSSKDDGKTKKLILFIGIPCLAVLVIIVVIVIICLLKNKKQYDRLKDQVNSISFKKDDALQRDSKDDDLLE